MNITVTIPPIPEKLRGALAGGGWRASVNRAVGQGLQQGVARYVALDARSRHATAQRLGARPTNFRADAVNLIKAPDALEITAGGGALWLPRIHFARAFRDVDIKPGAGKKYLTIPTHKSSYGKRLHKGELPEGGYKARFAKGFFFTGRASGKLCYGVKNAEGGVTCLYVLQESVHQKQDPTLLPTNEAMGEMGLKQGRNALMKFAKETLEGLA